MAHTAFTLIFMGVRVRIRGPDAAIKNVVLGVVEQTGDGAARERRRGIWHVGFKRQAACIDVNQVDGMKWGAEKNLIGVNIRVGRRECCVNKKNKKEQRSSHIREHTLRCWRVCLFPAELRELVNLQVPRFGKNLDANVLAIAR